jgi:hypothetical protein
MIKRATLLLFVLASASCASARALRNAQDHFNRAADLENQARLQRTSTGVTVPPGAEAEYRAALASLEIELKKHEAKLQEEGLWFSARLLKAQCLWRIAALGAGTFQEIALVRREVQELAELSNQGRISPGTRDRVLLAALPGLLDHEQGIRAASFAEAKQAFSDADATIEKAIGDKSLSEKHEIRLYLRLAQMAAMREWLASVTRFNEKKQEEDKPYARFKVLKEDLKRLIGTDSAYRPLEEVARSLSDAAGVTW